MPRLVGKQSNGSWSIGLFLFLAIAIAGSLEYVGLIQVIPGFGWDHETNGQPHLPFLK